MGHRAPPASTKARAQVLSLLALAACTPAPSSTAAAPVPTAEAAPPPPPARAPRFVESSSADCPAPPLPPVEELPVISGLPDPFLSGSGQRIASKSDWTCRRAEIRSQIEFYELGPKPPRPSIVKGELAGDRLTVTAGEPERTVSFSVNIAQPPSAAGPVPALIVIGRSALAPVFASRGIAVITFDNGGMGAQGNRREGDAYTNTRGQGTFYDLYGKDHGASSMMAWAWGVSRIIDALESTPAANVDVKRLAVSGCSRNGKGALVVGAFDERIALTVPQESGAGGSASWRISQAQMDEYRATVNASPKPGEGIQTLASAAGEQPWFRESFARFGTSSADVARLPFDHHMLLGLVAPRGLFVLDNTDMMWLGSVSSFTTSVAAAEIYAALGAGEAMGASQVGGHPHCTEVPETQLAELGHYIDELLLGKHEARQPVLRSDKIVPDRARWITWSTPALR